MNGIKVPNYKCMWNLGNSTIIDRWTKFDRTTLKRYLNPCNSEMSLIEEKNLQAFMLSYIEELDDSSKLNKL